MTENTKATLTNKPKEYYHCMYESILKALRDCTMPVMLVGPAGSGKNVCVKQVADALNLPMYYTNNVSEEYKITGFIDANGKYHETEFYKAFKNGGLFFIDEIDSSHPSALILLNSALSNGYFTFPTGTVDRHPNFKCIAAANTYGNGGDHMYVGRNTLDSATLDRFCMFEFNYDEKLEQALFPYKEALDFIWESRKIIAKNRIRHTVSTRGIKMFYEMRKAGFSLADTMNSVIIKGMEEDDKQLLISELRESKLFNKKGKSRK